MEYMGHLLWLFLCFCLSGGRSECAFTSLYKFVHKFQLFVLVVGANLSTILHFQSTSQPVSTNHKPN